jgi:uncharacterized lipoprotein YddW (UPF0748 family)
VKTLSAIVAPFGLVCAFSTLLVFTVFSAPVRAQHSGAGPAVEPVGRGMKGPGTGAGTELRCAWVTRWAFKSPGDISTTFEKLRAAGINTVFFQVRGACTVLYPSEIEPWSGVLEGKLGEDPGWDPLDTAVSEAHKRGLDIHAWINVFPAWPVSESPRGPRETEPRHVVLEHPEWLARNRRGEIMPIDKSEAKHSYAFLSPSVPAVRAHIIRVVEEIVSNYEVDGLHLDYVRFPDSTYSYDEVSTSAYKSYAPYAPHGMTYALWRTIQLTDFIREIKKTVTEARPHAILSATMRRDAIESMEYFLQDGIEWIRQGYVDLLVPMIYTTSMDAFEKSVREYSLLVGEDKVVAGMGAYLDSFDDMTFAGQVQIARSYDLRGIAVFNSDYAVRYGDLLKTMAARK